MSQPLILGIDGGGSKTLVALARADGEIAAFQVGGGINPMDQPGWRGELDRLLASLAAGGLERGGLAVGAVAAGMPAYGEIAALSAEQAAAVGAHFASARQNVVNDVEAAHYGAFAGGPGVLLLAGTGSMVWASDGAGRALRVGGYGEAIGDEGSAYWIGHEAVALASRAIDGRTEAPDFLAAFFAHLHLDAGAPQDALIFWHASLRHPRSEIAALAMLVDRLAEAGDASALAILDAAALHLAQHVGAARRRIGAAELGWSIAGGAFASRILRERTAALIGSRPLAPRLPPIGGALLRAARDLDWPVDEAWIERLAASIEKNAVHARNGRNDTSPGWDNHR